MPDYRASIYDKMRFGEPERALERAGRTGQGLQRLASDLFAARARDKEREEQKQKELEQKQKDLEQKETQEREGGNTQKLLAMYNDPNSPEFEGMEPYRKSLKMERLLYKINPEMSKRFGEQAAKEREMTDKNAMSRELLGMRTEASDDRNNISKINSLGVQYRNARNAMTLGSWKNLPKAEQNQAIAEMKSIREALAGMGDLGKAMVGKVESEATPQPEEKPTFDYEGAKDALRGLAVDADDNGEIDDVAGFDAALAELISKSGLGENDDSVRNLQTFAKSLKDGIKANYKANVDKNKRINDDQRYDAGIERDATRRAEDKNFDLEKEATKFQPIYGSFRRLRENPNDISAKSDALTRLLRDESGAAIAESEYLGRLRSVLPDDKFKELSKKLSGAGRWIAGVTGLENERMESIMFEYLGFMDANKMLSVMKDRTGMGRVYDYLEKNYKGYSPQGSAPAKGRKVVKDVNSFFGGN
jgi:hypothetical protein